MKYDFKTVEAKWQKVWEDEDTFHVEIDHSKPKFYALVEFPYPSAAGLQDVYKRQDLDGKPAVILVIGVNGVGKTTTIAKLAALYKKQGRRVMLAAGDTFRAAASEQLELWAQRADVPLVQAGICLLYTSRCV